MCARACVRTHAHVCVSVRARARVCVCAPDQLPFKKGHYPDAERVGVLLSDVQLWGNRCSGSVCIIGYVHNLKSAKRDTHI